MLKYASVLEGEVEKPGLGPFHTELMIKGMHIHPRLFPLK